MRKIALFASGSGTNVENIIKYFDEKLIPNQYLVLVNNRNAKVIEKAEKRNVPVVIFDKEMLNGEEIQRVLLDFSPDLIVLAGFLWKFPEALVQLYPNKVINIHPALLPKYGGKGMYGHHVHEAVLANKEKETGITIHYVNEHYDEGGIIFQEKSSVEHCTTWEDIAKVVQVLEHKHFPIVIDKLLFDE
ncbi:MULTISPECIES: phosphoribosylglycinamide formyltransferase [Myroides]|uniref:phosphoribosylglycinamide formyltransferase 1 n=1 Tax=Myroides albus TaxID=2562892 RepID=A0A6I3LDG6_9FLAO|nr:MULTISPECIES: phosphoribosylglycinamide formyltransferase [Myroides]MTG97549.1 phosphoribosylglycinamide formyltransferase [Myroides albus]MVX35073.1 phosphoribosylglycinamide formyltransferase [Myroides sp. LoEW2-1]UVD81174.1 phosphoribosylglycinamide formyltransferase [Myroides albus]